MKNGVSDTAEDGGHVPIVYLLEVILAKYQGKYHIGQVIQNEYVQHLSMQRLRRRTNVQTLALSDGISL